MAVRKRAKGMGKQSGSLVQRIPFGVGFTVLAIRPYTSPIPSVSISPPIPGTFAKSRRSASAALRLAEPTQTDISSTAKKSTSRGRE